ncbi:hypothetical protein AHAS_Ahas16G0033900 [Arachis hypogaea]
MVLNGFGPSYGWWLVRLSLLMRRGEEDTCRITLAALVVTRMMRLRSMSFEIVDMQNWFGIFSTSYIIVKTSIISTAESVYLATFQINLISLFCLE